jgi:hypothetical protein
MTALTAPVRINLNTTALSLLGPGGDFSVVAANRGCTPYAD